VNKDVFINSALATPLLVAGLPGLIAMLLSCTVLVISDRQRPSH